MPKPEAKLPAVEPRIDKRVMQYLSVREAIEQIKEKHKQELEKYEAIKSQISGELSDFLDRTGQKSAKTAYGTVSISVRTTASCSDPDAFIAFVRENDAYELIDRKANAVACRQYAEENGSLPPGVKLNSARIIGVTKA